MVQTTLTVNGASVPVAVNGAATFVATTPGIHNVVAQASDAAGNTGQDTTSFTMDADTMPPTVSVTADPDPVMLTETVSISVTATDDVAVVNQTLRVSGPAFPSGIDLTLDGAGQATFTPFQPGTYTLDATATDSSGNTGMASTTFEATGTPDTTPPTVQIQVVPNPVGVGTPVTVTVTVTDASPIESTTLTINDTPIPLDSSGQAVYAPPILGTFTVAAVARDTFGNPGNASTTFEAVAPEEDTQAPFIAISSPTTGSELSAPVDIIGTVQDQTLVQYTLDYGPRGGNDFTVFATGHANVTDGVLGRFDPTLLRNDVYEVRLTAEDSQGRIVRLTVAYQVTGGLKVGHFRISLEDLLVPVSGLPISIIRAYDSRDLRKGDFGFGWELDIQTINVNESTVLGSDWDQVSGSAGPISFFCVEPRGPHFVSVALPDGRVERFDFLPFIPEGARTLPGGQILPINCQSVFPVAFATSSFTPRTGTTSTLISLEGDDLAIIGGEGLVTIVPQGDLTADRSRPLPTHHGRWCDL